MGYSSYKRVEQRKRMFSRKKNFVDFEDKTFLINEKEGILMHF
jgi:hypothetical protein